jgi:hypothetical protein
VGDRKASTIADSNVTRGGRRKGRKTTKVGSHVCRGAGVDDPISSSRVSSRVRDTLESGEQLEVPR